MPKQFWLPIPLCINYHFNTVTWISIELSTHPVGCHGGTRRRYGKNDVIFCPKTTSSQIWLPILHSAIVLTLLHGSTLNFPQSQWVVMVPQADVMTTMTSYLVQNSFSSNFEPLFSVVPPFQYCHMIQHQILYKPSGCHYGTSHRYDNNDVIICPKTMSNHFLPPFPFCATVFTLSHDLATISPQSLWVTMVAKAVAMAAMTMSVLWKPWPSNLTPFSPVSLFQHCQMTQHQLFHKPNGLQWWHKQSLRQLSRHILSETYFQTILTLNSWLCHRFNTATWLNIELSTNSVICNGGTSRRFGNKDVTICPKTIFKPIRPLFLFELPFHCCHMTHSIKLSTNPLGCHGGTSRCYDNNYAIFCPKTMPKQILPVILLCATVSTLSSDSVLNAPQTHWIDMVAQAVAMASMSSLFVQKPWPSIFDTLFSFVPLFHTHDSA